MPWRDVFQSLVLLDFLVSWRQNFGFVAHSCRRCGCVTVHHLRSLPNPYASLIKHGKPVEEAYRRTNWRKRCVTCDTASSADITEYHGVDNDGAESVQSIAGRTNRAALRILLGDEASDESHLMETEARRILFDAERHRMRYAIRGHGVLLSVVLTVVFGGMIVAPIVWMTVQAGSSSPSLFGSSNMYVDLIPLFLLCAGMLSLAGFGYWYTQHLAPTNAAHAIVDEIADAGINPREFRKACDWAEKFDLELMRRFNKKWLLEELGDRLSDRDSSSE